MTGNAIRDAIDASTLARSLDAVVIWGGPHATLFSAELEQEPCIDHVITGFGARSTVPKTVNSRGTDGPMLVTLSKGPTRAEAFAPDLSLVSD